MTTAGLAAGLFTFAAGAQEAPRPNTGELGAAPQFISPGVQAGYVFKPESSRPTAPGFAHTNYVLRSLDGSRPAAAAVPDSTPVFSPDGTVSLAETPCSLGNLYVSSPSTACTPSFTAKGGPSAAGYGAIALVDAFDNPDAATDLAQFSSHFGLPSAKFVKVFANGNGSCKTVPANAGWALEESLDIEWAHVFAPSAAIILVEACSNSTADLLYAEKVAFQYIVKNYPAGGQVSNSWSGAEFSGQIADDATFADFTYNYTTGYKTHILAFASAGDSGEGAAWPSTDPWVISAGGTTVLRNSSAPHAVTSEACWSGSGGGISTIETYKTSFTGGNMGPWANYQYPIYGQANRATPDIAFDADPASGVYMLSNYNGGWFIVGGTSLSSPALAGIVNRAGDELSSVSLNPVTGNTAFFSTAEHNLLYAELPQAHYSRDLNDVTTGSNGAAAVRGYDLCTGVGTPRSLDGK
jgi:subtilase family serine protease